MPSYKAAVTQKCRDCTYDPHGEGNWRQQVSACTVTTCALYPVRPRSVPRKRPSTKLAEIAEGSPSTESLPIDDPGKTLQSTKQTAVGTLPHPTGEPSGDIGGDIASANSDTTPNLDFLD